ncbi:ATP-grasp domain-containing protein, partial [Streptomyces sp. SID11233]|nr:ATP-grasp domain-containing protein [Streptomyces sp. SID11233]
AVLLAEYRTELSGRFLLPPVDPALPRSLASKQGLYEACRAHGVDTPETSFPESPADVAEFARHARFPVIVKNREAFV